LKHRRYQLANMTW